MKLGEMQDFFIKEAINADLRGREAVEADLNKRKTQYDALSDARKKLFDAESLKNPYYDSRIIFGDPQTEVKSIFAAIDVDTQEILLAKYLIDSGKKIDVIISHHPEGYAYATFHNIGHMQTDILNKFGVPINVAEKIVLSRIKEVEKSILPQNSQRVSDAAKLLNIPFMTAHTVADNQVAFFLHNEFEKAKPQYLGDILSSLSKLPEYLQSSKEGHSPQIFLGNENSRCGKIFVDMTGGFEGPTEMFAQLSAAGIGTIVSMHMGKKSLDEAEKYKFNVVIAGHISSDNLGLNLMFDKLEKEYGKLEFIQASGFRRFRR
ncbi:MAG: NGG1p interacting factor NIF3 [Elusimicrobiota bacterium]|jgi:putative NIF3 family GTP cyclohydrolase 1 type 2|nr:NGG1p interacting factor NIF3 [Elusimicrobiota bacterium]